MTTETKTGVTAEAKAPAKISIDADALKEALAAALKQGISDGMAMAALSANQKPADPRTVPVERCGECMQDKKACKSKHRVIAVYPKNQRWGRWFQGVMINGVRYLSDNQSHLITVPAEADIEYMIYQWERNEERMVDGRDNTGIHLGTIGPNGRQINPHATYIR